MTMLSCTDLYHFVGDDPFLLAVMHLLLTYITFFGDNPFLLVLYHFVLAVTVLILWSLAVCFTHFSNAFNLRTS